MDKKLPWVGAALMLLLCSCGPSTRPSTPSRQPAQTAAPSKAATRTTRPGAFSREQLIADARQLADILESAHPDPYINGGGRIAFHRRLHRVLNAIPDEGMTRDEFYRLLRPFIAGVGDAHTNFTGGYEVDRRHPGGIPLRLAVVEESLVVFGVAQQAHQDLLGARLVSVEGVPLAELVDRQKQLRGIVRGTVTCVPISWKTEGYEGRLSESESGTQVTVPPVPYYFFRKTSVALLSITQNNTAERGCREHPRD